MSDDADQPAVLKVNGVFDAALARKFEADGRTTHGDAGFVVLATIAYLLAH